MKLFFDYETKSTFSSLLDNLLPPITLAELQIFDASTQHHIAQIERRCEPEIESEAGRAIPMLAILDEPGRYVSDGHSIEPAQ